MQQLWPIMAMQAFVVTALALGAAWTARKLRAPGWCGALIVGLVCGAVLHSGWSGLAFDPVFTGGRSRQQAIDQLITGQQTEWQALVATGVTSEAVMELDAAHHAALQPLIDAHAATIQRHHAATRWLTVLGMAVLLLIAAGNKPGRLADALPVALGASVCIAAGAYAVMGLLGAGPWEALAAGCAAAAVPVGSRYVAALKDEQGASLVGSVAWWLLTIGLAAACGLDAKYGLSVAVMGLMLALTLLGRALDRTLRHNAWRLLAALGLGAAWFKLAPDAGALLPVAGAWIVGQVLAHANIDLSSLRRLFGPIVALVIGVTANVLADFHPWLLVALLIVMCDLRAIGVWGVTRLLGSRNGLHFATVLAIAGPATLIVAWLLHDTTVINAPVFNALILAALISGLLGGPMLRLLNASTEPPAPGS